MSLLYIIKGEHSTVRLKFEDEETYNQFNGYSLKCGVVQLEIITEIARKKRNIRYFCDDVSADVVDCLNGIVENIANRGNEAVRGLFENVKDLDSYSDLINELKRFAELRREGIEIKYYKTEDDYGLEIFEGKISDEGMALICLYILGGGSIRDLATSDRFGLIVNEYRDSCVFRNVCSQAGDVNILFMGRDHELMDFKKGKHDFDIYEVEVKYEEGVKVGGSLPVDMRSFMNSLSGRFNLESRVVYRR